MVYTQTLIHYLTLLYYAYMNRDTIFVHFSFITSTTAVIDLH